MPEDFPTYPAVKLTDHTTISFRRLQASDTSLLVDFYDHLSEETRFLRFQFHTEGMSREKIFAYAQQLTDIDPETALAIVAVYQEAQQETFVGVIRYAKENVQDRTAEFAITVRDDFQQKKIGTHLLHLLIEEAKKQEVDFLTGMILPSNTSVVKLLKKAGEKVSFASEGVQTHVHIDVRST